MSLCGYKRTEDDVIKTKELIKLQDKVRIKELKMERRMAHPGKGTNVKIAKRLLD